MINAVNPLQFNINQTAFTPAPVQAQPFTQNKSNLLTQYLNSRAAINQAAITQATTVSTVALDKQTTPTDYKNNLKTLFATNSAKILAIIPRTFNAKDTNGNEYIENGEQHGTFLNAIERLDEVKADGFNALHVLPIHPPGKQKAMGTAGSLYAPDDLLAIDPVLIDKNDPRSPKEQFKAFIDACHQRGIKVMIDLPSCASYDMFLREPDLMAKEADGGAKTPQGWNDIRMFQSWDDEGKRLLNSKLLDLHEKYIDWCVELGIDGIRADVARAKPPEFWDRIIPYSRKLDPEFGWLGETYTYEDASPQANMPYDRPIDSWRCGFDTIYGQYHIFNEWNTASEFNNYVKDQLFSSFDVPKGKSLIGSFATHDDVSPMFHGGTEYCNLTMGLQATLPMLNPYIVDGYQSGDWYKYGYEHTKVPHTRTDNHEMTVHHGKLDIFNLSRKPGGKNPEIGDFMRKSFELKDKYADVINNGTFIPLEKQNDRKDQVIAYARHYNGKTLLVVANKNVNKESSCIVSVPGLKSGAALNNLLPSYGKESQLQAANDELRVQLGPARVHVFEIDTPQIECHVPQIYRQSF